MLLSQNKDRDLTTGKILLIADIFVGTENQIVSGSLGLQNQIAVLQLMPADFPREADIVPNKARVRLAAMGLGVPLSNRILISRTPVLFPSFHEQSE